MLGLSTDSIESHEKFAGKYGLTMPLVSDPEAAVCKRYGVYKQKNMYGKTYMGIERTTFVIDRHGLINTVYPKVKVEGNAARVLADLKDSL